MLAVFGLKTSILSVVSKFTWIHVKHLTPPPHLMWIHMSPCEVKWTVSIIVLWCGYLMLIVLWCSYLTCLLPMLTCHAYCTSWATKNEQQRHVFIQRHVLTEVTYVFIWGGSKTGMSRTCLDDTWDISWTCLMSCLLGPSGGHVTRRHMQLRFACGFLIVVGLRLIPKLTQRDLKWSLNSLPLS